MQIKEINVSRPVCFNIGQQYSNEVLVIHFKGLPDLPNKYIYVKKDNYEKEVPLVGDMYVVSRPLTTYNGEVKAQIIARDPGSTPIALTPNFKMMITPSNYSGIGEDENYPDDPNIKNYFVKIDGKIQSMDELIALVQSKLDNGEFIGAQGPKGEKGDPGEKGEPGDVTEEFKNLANQIAQNASDAQASATKAQVSATNAQKALDDTKEFANQTKTELNQIKTDTNTLKDEANTSAVNAKASEDKAKEYADNLKESTDAISQNTKAISELADKKITKFYASNQGETHVSDSDNGKIMDMMLYGQSEQKQYRGKNLLKIRDGTQTTRGITVTAKDGVLSLKGTATSSGWALLDVDSFVLDGTCIISANISNRVLGLNKSYEKVMENDRAYTLENAEVSHVCIVVEGGKTYDISNILVQIEKGSEATSYEPYVGGKPSPSPNYPQEIKRVVNPTIKVIGKNLWKIHGNGYINNTNGNIADSHIETYGVTDFIKMKKNIVVQSKSFDKTSNYAFAYRVGFYDSEKKWIQNIIIQTLSNPNVVDIGSFHISKAEYIRVSAPNTIFDDLQIEYGTQASEYEPYKEQSIALPITLNAIPVSSGGNITINGQQYIADYVDVERGKIVRRVDSSKLDNTQSIIAKTEWLLVEQQETNLTTEQVQALKELATYYPVTNIAVGSDQLDGYTVFNYPISLANGWNYVKQQLNDNRDYIYDMDLQSAEAYVNSEYAVTLTELEV